jgi:ComF family protein
MQSEVTPDFRETIPVWISDFLAPSSCAFCGTLQVEKANICDACFDDLPWNEAPLSSLPGGLDCSIAMLQYAFPVDVAIKALKFNRKLFYAPAFVEILREAQSILPEDIDAVLAVPLHWRRKTLRGFNQATELAKPLAKSIGVPIIRSVRRCKATPFQSGLGAAERASNLRKAFTAPRAIQCKHVLVIDDVITTGATVQAVATSLQAAGAIKVSVLAVARAGL